MNTETFNTILGVGTIVLQFKILYLLVHLMAPKWAPVPEFAKKRYLYGVFGVAFLAVIGSMIYSEVIGFPPCSLCWYQRIAIFGIAIISLTALVKRYSKEMVSYVQVFSILGMIIAVFHIIQEKTGVSVICSAGGLSCSKQLVFALGYISIPMMSLSVLLVIFLITILMKRESRK